jgi:HSP20 family protein
MLSRLWHNGSHGLDIETLSPSIDLSETEKSIDVRMDIPGVTADDIDIRVDGNLLTISGQRQEEKEEKGRTFHRIERTEGSFLRTVALPCEVQENKIVAEYKDGVLNLSMPKCAESKSHKIKIQSKS